MVSNSSSLPEVVGEVGITVDPLNLDAVTDAIKRSLKNNKINHEEEIKKHLNKYDWKILSSEFEKVFDK